MAETPAGRKPAARSSRSSCYGRGNVGIDGFFFLFGLSPYKVDDTVRHDRRSVTMSKETALMSRTIYALLIGIDDYPSPIPEASGLRQ